MKRICTTLLLTAAVMFTCAVSAAADAVTAQYDLKDGSVEITGNIGEEADVAVTVCITDDADNTFSDTNTPIAAYVVFTSENGAINDRRSFDDLLPSGALNLLLTSKNGSAECEILVFSDESEGTKAVLKTISETSDAATLAKYLGTDNNIEKLGFRYEDTEKYLKEIAQSCILRHSEAGHELTLTEVVSAIHYAMLMGEVKDGVNIEESMAKHYSGFECEYSEFAALSDKLKTEMQSLIKSADYLSKTIDYSELLLVSQARAATESWSKLRDVLTENADAYELDMGSGSDWADIATTKRQNVFYNMLSSVKTAERIKDISKAFASSTSTVKKQSSSSSSSGGSSSGGGSGSSRDTGGLISYTPQKPADYEDKSNISFTDIDGHFSAAAAEYLVNKGIISGYPDKSFRPDTSVTRAEFAGMIQRAFDFKALQKNISFSDVSEGDWFCKSVETLAENGIVYGYGGLFNPNDIISRQDAAVILKNVIDAKGKSLDSITADFKDSGNISDYAVPGVGTLSGAGIIQGSDGYFRPADPVTRGEAAVMLHRMLTIINWEG